MKAQLKARMKTRMKARMKARLKARLKAKLRAWLGGEKNNKCLISVVNIYLLGGYLFLELGL